MNDRYQLVEATAPTDFALREAIRSFIDKSEIDSTADMLQDFLVLVGRACSRLEAGSTEDAAVADLVFHGLDQECAQTVVRKASEIVESDDQLQDAPHGRQTGRNWLALVGVLIVLLIAAYAVTSG